MARILLADDDRRVSLSLASVLRAAGHEVVEVHAGPVALRLSCTPPYPDVVVLDHHMPDLAGLEIAPHLQGRIPFIVISGDRELAPAFATRGAACVLHKPVDAADLLAAIGACLGDSAAQHRP